ncbi:hypothetical protein [Rhodoferax sp. U11-2br]|uniref:hypothetical protein n=1 Tax=Rhodoferax sp. U11-2br TaxID=2838878 RepID=UPI001BE69A8F|nr:hypothetical protein [Rhodoferax sp. U11-2br]MBT3066897.1 hypothetical protein [Rhodoferax sp. U11-2br]
MFKTSHRLPRLASLVLATTCLCGLSLPICAGPIVLQDGKAPADAMVDTSKLVTLEHQDTLPVDELINWDKSNAPPAAPQGRASSTTAAQATASSPAKPAQAVASAATAAANTQPTVGDELRKSIKEGVRPVYDQLLESGAIDAVHDVKESLGLNKGQWNDPAQADGQPKAANQWDTPETFQPPKTAAQAQMDRELAGMMREKLIDQITPWVVGLVGLYILGYLAKLLYGYMRWKSARRMEQHIHRAKRHAAHSQRSARSPAGTPTQQAPLEPDKPV